VVALLVGLKLTLLRNGLRRSVWRTVGLILGAVYALAIVVGVWLGLGALRLTSTELTGDVTVLGFSVLTLGWLLFSLLVFGIDETVDPRRFALLPVPARRLVPGLLVAGLFGIPGLATVLMSLGLLLTWSRSLTLTLAAVVAVPLGVATCFLLSRTATAAFTQALASRRFRDFAAVALALVGASIGIVSNLISGGASGDPQAALRLLHSVGRAFGWTPVGWAWSLPADVARGDWGVAGVHLVLAVALVGGLWWAWGYFLERALTSPLETGGASKAVKRNGFVDRLYPATPAGAVAARALRYWRRDPRYLSSLGAILVAPIVIVVALISNPGRDATSPIAAFAPAFLAVLLGAVVSQDLSYDGSAVWAHITTGVSGAVDRTGRVLSTLTVMGPVLVVMVVAAAAVTGEWTMLPRSIGLTVGLALISIGVGSWVGSVWQIPAPPPGANPFAKNTNGNGLQGLLSFAVTSALTLACSLPLIAVVVGSFWVPALEWVALLVGVVTGLIVLRAGIRLGGARLDSHWPEVLSAVTAKG
jgi:ABC-2 type transport system permease protein